MLKEIQNIKNQISELIKATENKFEILEELRNHLSALSPNHAMPIDNVLWMDIDRVQSNDYNPNSVAFQEMKLLYVSIKNDGYTQPVVTFYDEGKDKYVIVDGFHRYLTMKNRTDIRESCNGRLPIVVIKKDIADRMASTVRHNRARGKHAIDGMSNLVFKMLDEGWSESHVCNELGMEAEELVRLKYITGFSKLFESMEYQKSWKTRAQIKAEIEYEKKRIDGIN